MSQVIPTGPAGRQQRDFSRPRPLIVESDAMEPTLSRTRDIALVVPVDRYSGEGIYAFDDSGFGIAIRRCEATGSPGNPCVAMSLDNERYRNEPTVITKEAFADVVLGRIVGRINFLDGDAYRAFCERIRREENPT